MFQNFIPWTWGKKSWMKESVKETETEIQEIEEKKIQYRYSITINMKDGSKEETLHTCCDGNAMSKEANKWLSGKYIFTNPREDGSVLIFRTEDIKSLIVHPNPTEE